MIIAKKHMLWFLVGAVFIFLECEPNVNETKLKNVIFNQNKALPTYKIILNDSLNKNILPSKRFFIVKKEGNTYYEPASSLQGISAKAMTISNAIVFKDITDNTRQNHTYTTDTMFIFAKANLDKNKLKVHVFWPDDEQDHWHNCDNGFLLSCKGNIVMGEYHLILEDGSKRAIQNDSIYLELDHYPVRKGDIVNGYFTYDGLLNYSTDKPALSPLNYWGYFRCKVE